MNAYSVAATHVGEDRDVLIEEHIVLVKRIAHHMSARLPKTVELDDLYQSGMVGLLEAARNFDPTRGASFETFAGIRIRGAMLDEVRRHDWTPRAVHRKQREVSQAMRAIEAETGSAATPAQIASHLDISIDEYHETLNDVAACKLFSLDTPYDDTTQRIEPKSASSSNPDHRVSWDQRRQEISQAITRLSEREQLVLSLYYERELNLKEIGLILGVSESRVCQIHSQAALRIRAIVEE